MKMKVVISARQSDLARLQAKQVGHALTKAHPDLEVSYLFKSSKGDLDLTSPLWQMKDKGSFTEDFKEDLRSGRCDMVVHSWKDLPVEDDPLTLVAATLPRGDLRDVLFINKQSLFKSELAILSSSPRREYNLQGSLVRLLPWKVEKLSFRPVRGNIATRIKKFLDPSHSGGVIAKAALDRIASSTEDEFSQSREAVLELLQNSRWLVVPLVENPPAPGQGALAIEVLRTRADLKSLLEGIQCRLSYEAVCLEREELARHGGGCHQKIGVAALPLSDGLLKVKRGLTDQKIRLDEYKFVPRELGFLDWPKALDEKRIYPAEPGRENLFDRHEIFFAQNQLGQNQSAKNQSAQNQLQEESPRGFLVSRMNAWPKNFHPSERDIVWTSGLKTWESLALRGIWVNGTFESLGENSLDRCLSWDELSQSKRKWLKFTHESSAKLTAELTAKLTTEPPPKLTTEPPPEITTEATPEQTAKLATELTPELAKDSSVFLNYFTYRLVPKSPSVDWSTKEYFYWMSGSAFNEAVKQDPSIAVRGYHSSGLGSSSKYIRARLSGEAKYAPFVDYESWRAFVVAGGK